MPYWRASDSLRKVQLALSRSVTLRSCSSTLEINSRISVSKLLRIAVLKLVSMGSTLSSSSRLSQPSAKFSTSARARSSLSIRATCACMTAGCDSLLAAARSTNVWSGPVLHRKKDRREASSKSVSKRDCVTCSGVGNARYRKSGLDNTAVTNSVTPESKPPASCRPRSYSFIKRCTSVSLTGRR